MADSTNDQVKSDFSFINELTGLNYVAAKRPTPLDETVAPGTVLVADDNDSILKIIVDAVQAQGYPVYPVGRGDQAMAVFGRHHDKIPLAIVDECLPGLHGTELVREMHELEPDTKVILISGYFGDDGHPPIVDRSRVVFLDKPFELRRLIDLVKRLCPQSQPGSISR